MIVFIYRAYSDSPKHINMCNTTANLNQNGYS